MCALPGVVSLHDGVSIRRRWRTRYGVHPPPPSRGFYRVAGSTKSENITFERPLAGILLLPAGCGEVRAWWLSPEGRFFNVIRMKIDGVVPGKERVLAVRE